MFVFSLGGTFINMQIFMSSCFVSSRQRIYIYIMQFNLSYYVHVQSIFQQMFRTEYCSSADWPALFVNCDKQGV